MNPNVHIFLGSIFGMHFQRILDGFGQRSQDIFQLIDCKSCETAVSCKLAFRLYETLILQGLGHALGGQNQLKNGFENRMIFRRHFSWILTPFWRSFWRQKALKIDAKIE